MDNRQNTPLTPIAPLRRVYNYIFNLPLEQLVKLFADWHSIDNNGECDLDIWYEYQDLGESLPEEELIEYIYEQATEYLTHPFTTVNLSPFGVQEYTITIEGV